MSNISKPRLPSDHSETITHPSIADTMVRERTSYWWPSYQVQLEDEAAQGKRTLVHGTFYVFLQDETTVGGKTVVRRYGNVYMTDHWIKRTVMVPKEHPDADAEPYKMVWIADEWRSTFSACS
jgi:hypothetical protein